MKEQKLEGLPKLSGPKERYRRFGDISDDDRLSSTISSHFPAPRKDKAEGGGRGSRYSLLKSHYC